MGRNARWFSAGIYPMPVRHSIERGSLMTRSGARECSLLFTPFQRIFSWIVMSTRAVSSEFLVFLFLPCTDGGIAQMVRAVES